MDAKSASAFKILKASIALFREKGFDNTSIREIAAASGVSVGLINHYFMNKDILGTQCLLLIDQYASQNMVGNLSIDDEPILYDLVATRVLYQYMRRNGYEQFYADSLKNDFFFKYLSKRPSVIVQKLSRFYDISGTDDEIQLYCRFMPYMMEKTLVLKKSEGLFPSISDDQIPYYIVVTALSHFIPESEIAAQDAHSIRLSDEYLAPLQPVIPDEFIGNYVERYIRDLEEASAYIKSQVILQMKRN